MASPGQGDARTRAQTVSTRNRLEQCWSYDIKWDLYQENLYKVSVVHSILHPCKKEFDLSLFTQMDF